MIFPLLFIFVITIAPPIKCQKRGGFLWKIEAEPRPSYLFGTVHLPYRAIWDDLMPEIKTALNESDAVFLETHTNDTAETALEVVRCLQSRPGKNVSKTLIDQLRPYYTLPVDIERIKPVMLFYILTAVQQKLGTTTNVSMLTSLDSFIAREAARMNKITGGVETALDQCDAFFNAVSEHIELLLKATRFSLRNKTLNNNNSSNISYRTLLEQYNRGNASFFRRIVDFRDEINARNSNEQELQFANNFRRVLFADRNRKMAANVARLLEKEPRRGYFFAFGVGHFLGKSDNVVDLLISKGYEVNRITPKIRSKR